MCGICGIVWADGSRQSPPGLVHAMTERLRHRGPDGAGLWEQAGVSLGHRRLSIIDLPGGSQPMANEDRTVWVVFNGEIYNYAALRDRLEASGHTFATHSDTEVLVHLYEDRGPGMLEHLRGMFAFALWDQNERTLLLARDRLGVKPLVYRDGPDGLRFASEIKALAAEPGFPRTIEVAALDDYLAYQYVPYPGTIFRDVKKLPPAHYGLYRDGKLQIERYWQPDYRIEDRRPIGEYLEELRSVLAEATKLRMISDVPLGAFLSGGIDSTIVVGLMRRAAAGPVKTFSIGFGVPEFDERRFARTAAEHLETDHHELVVEPDAVDVVSKLAWFYDEPFGDSSAVPTYYVSKLTREHVTVALTGDAGDELFAGYPRYQAVRLGEWCDRLPKLLRRALVCSCWQRLPAPATQKSRLRRLKKLLRLLDTPAAERYRQFVSIFDDALRPALFSDGLIESLNGHRAADWIDGRYAELAGRDFLTRTTYVDLVTYLPGDLLVKVDIASMANSLECRSPFLDHEVVALAGRMPIALKLRGLTTKYVLKKAFAEFLPGQLRRRAKMGFGVPIDHWLRAELAPMLRDLLQSCRFRQRGWFRPETIDRLIREHLAAEWDHSARLWALLMLELWAQNYLDR